MIYCKPVAMLIMDNNSETKARRTAGPSRADMSTALKLHYISFCTACPVIFNRENYNASAKDFRYVKLAFMSPYCILF
jgi:hypothetical protein